MIAACPTCGARYRIDVTQLRSDGARLRCSRCETVFRVRAPESAPAAEIPEAAARRPVPGPVTGPAPMPSAPGPVTGPAPTPSAPGPVTGPAPTLPSPKAVAGSVPTPPVTDTPRNRERLVLVAHPEKEKGKRIIDAVSDWGLEALLVHDGVEAILNIQRALPRVVILDAALPKMFGFQVCELMKRNESLREIHVVLVGAVHDQDRYRRPPGDLYGADAYIELHELPDSLRPVLAGLGLRLRGEGSAENVRPAVPPVAGFDESLVSPNVEQRPLAMTSPAPEPESLAPAVPTPEVTAPAASGVPSVSSPEPAHAPPVAMDPPAATSSAPSPEGSPSESVDLQSEAERLARIIVSDIVLYSPEKFEEGVRAGDVVAALRGELEEGRVLFAQRIDAQAGNPDTFLQGELVRVARERGMVG